MNVKPQATSFFFSALLLLWLAPVMMDRVTVHAATFTVTKTADTADGACNADCSLREAIIAANAAATTDTIQLPAGLYTLTLTNVTVSDNTADNGGGISNSGNLTIMASTLSHNTAVIGGGVTNTGEGFLTLVNSTVSGNTAQQDGGGLHNQADARIRNSTLAENSIQTPGASEEIANAEGAIILSNTLGGEHGKRLRWRRSAALLRRFQLG